MNYVLILYSVSGHLNICHFCRGTCLIFVPVNNCSWWLAFLNRCVYMHVCMCLCICACVHECVGKKAHDPWNFFCGMIPQRRSWFCQMPGNTLNQICDLDIWGHTNMCVPAPKPCEGCLVLTNSCGGFCLLSYKPRLRLEIFLNHLLMDGGRKLSCLPIKRVPCVTPA